MIDTLDLALERLGAASGEMRVATSTLLPSGALATVTVRPASNGTFLVSDGATGQADLHALGFVELTKGDAQRATAIATRFGLYHEDGAFFARGVSSQQLAAAIAFVAEAAREWSSRTGAKAAQRAELAMLQRVEDKVRHVLPRWSLSRDRELPGGSGKRHRFDLVAALANDGFAVFEVLAPNTNALSSTYMKLDDLRQADASWPREVVTERLDAWSNADMNLLAGVATHVRDLGRDWTDLEQLAA